MSKRLPCGAGYFPCLVAVAALCLNQGAVAADASKKGPEMAAGATVGAPIAGSRGIQRTTAEIMDAQEVAPPSTAPLHMPEHEIEGREDLLQNPESKPVASWPQSASRGNRNPGSRVGAAPLSGHTAPQTIGLTFDAITGPNDNGAFPPDTMGAVGPSQVFVFVNGRLKTFSKANGSADGVINASPNVFFSSVMTPVVPPVVLNFTSDPQIRFDRLSGRWFLSIIDVPCTSPSCSTLGANRWMVAVSDASSRDAITLGTVWTFFFFQADPSNFCDYPSLGVDSQAVYTGCDMFTPASSFVGTNGYVVRKSSLLAGGPIVVTSFANLGSPTSPGPVAPRGVDNYDPNSNEGYFIGPDLLTLGTLMLRRVSDPGGTPVISPNISIVVPTTSSSIPIDHLGNAGGSTGRIDSLDDRVYAAHIRNGRLWTAHNIRVNSDGVASSGAESREAVRWYELNGIRSADNGGVPVVVQSGTVFDSASTLAKARAFSIPTIMVSGQGHAALGFTTAGASFRIDAATIGRLALDPLGTTQTVALLSASNAAYNPPSDPGGPGGRRWGDYSLTSLDPTDDMTIWTVQEYCNGTNTYGCRVAQLLAPPPATPISASSEISIGQSSVDVVITGSSVSGSGFYDPGPGFNRIIASVTGGVVVNSISFTNPTQVKLTVDATNASAGPQNVTITNPDLQSRTGTGILILVEPPTPTPTASPSPSPSPTPTPTPRPAQAINLSTRLQIQTGDNAGIGGFIITGTVSKQILLRGIGPSLSSSGVPDALGDPVLELQGPSGFSTMANDNWRDDPTQEAAIIATGIPPTNDLEAAIVATLNPGSYTAIIRGKDATTGIGLVEVYDLDPGVPSKLSNISTRAFCGTGSNLMIAGFLLSNHSGPDLIVVRGLGPSLHAFGIPDPLVDPILQVRNSEGAQVGGNNDWQDFPPLADQLNALGLAPTNPLESALAVTLPPGAYTALLSGADNETGTGLVEVYDLGSM